MIKMMMMITLMIKFTLRNNKTHKFHNQKLKIILFNNKKDGRMYHQDKEDRLKHYNLFNNKDNNLNSLNNKLKNSQNNLNNKIYLNKKSKSINKKNKKNTNRNNF